MSEWKVRLYRGKYAAVRSHEGRTERISLRTADLGEAKRALADWLERPAGETVGEIVEVYLADKDKTAIRADDLHGSWKQAKATFGHLRPDQVTRAVCREYRDMRYAAGRKPNTVRKELECVRAALNFCKKGGEAVFELPAAPPTRARYLTKGEVKAMLKAARNVPHVRAFIALGIGTAARSSALLELTWDRVDFEQGVIKLARGTSVDAQMKGRGVVPMNKRVRRYLRVLKAAARTPYVIEWGGDRVRSVKRSFKAAAAKAGVEATPHLLRHTAISWMAMAKVPMWEISKYAGHSDTRVTERRYAHLSPDYLRGAAAALDW